MCIYIVKCTLDVVGDTGDPHVLLKKYLLEKKREQRGCHFSITMANA